MDGAEGHGDGEGGHGESGFSGIYGFGEI